MKLLVDLVGKPLECQSGHHFECPCIFGVFNERKRPLFYEIIERWKAVVEKVANMDEFNNREVSVGFV